MPTGGLARPMEIKVSSPRTMWKRSRDPPALRPIPLLVTLRRCLSHHPRHIITARQHNINPSIMGLPRLDTSPSHRNRIIHIQGHRVNKHRRSRLSSSSKRPLQPNRIGSVVASARWYVSEGFTKRPLELLISTKTAGDVCCWWCRFWSRFVPLIMVARYKG